MKEVTVAIIGCGRIAEHHCRSMLRIPSIRLVAVCDLIEYKAKKISRSYNVPWYVNYRKMLKDNPDINTVAIITPSGMHYEHSIEMLRDYKKNIIVEKPTFMNPDELNLAYMEADKNNLKIFPVFQNRYNKAVSFVKESIINRDLGDIRTISVRAQWCRTQDYYELAPWRGTFSHDGGALANQGIHHVDLLRYFGGEVDKVNCIMRTLGVDVEVEDTIVSTCAYDNSSVATLEVTTAARPENFEASITIVGSKGLARLGGIAANKLQIFTPNPLACEKYSEDFSKTVGVYGNGHNEMYKDISVSILSNAEFPVTKVECYNTLKLLNSFYLSDEKSNWINVSDKKLSSRLGRPNDKISALYRTEHLDD
ncbi:Gfo/Idh/MocA family oxidoreductase [bacterium]|jgi:UDP-N-acetyl-2-amino-2-deoxyglucuronate dehydrogenase|nr:Gfo/Idh/MocA family oxidoreductase [bacterium]